MIPAFFLKFGLGFFFHLSVFFFCSYFGICGRFFGGLVLLLSLLGFPGRIMNVAVNSSGDNGGCWSSYVG